MNTHRPTQLPRTQRHKEMPHAHYETPEAGHAQMRGGSMLLMLLGCVVLFAAVFLLTGSTSGIPEWLPWLLLLLCPLLHLFMHRNHGGH